MALGMFSMYTNRLASVVVLDECSVFDSTYSRSDGQENCLCRRIGSVGAVQPARDGAVVPLGSKRAGALDGGKSRMAEGRDINFFS